jgi:hypothetical protein
MVILGAGASYDSSPDYPPEPPEDAHVKVGGGLIVLREVRPPLANHLFESRDAFALAAERLPKCKPILDQLRRRSPPTSVEQELEKLQEKAIGYPEGLRQLASVQFYLQWVIGKCQSDWNRSIYSHTTYHTLIGQIDRQMRGESVCLVTFNYDTLLEEAFVSLGRMFESLDDYVSRTEYKIVKLHGSVNWARELTSAYQVNTADQIAVANEVAMKADTLKASDTYLIIPDEYRESWVVGFMDVPGKPGRQAVLPAIAIPLEKKHDYVCPPSHIQVLKECISKTDKLLVIGWKGADENFLKLLSERLDAEIPKMIVSSGNDSAENIKSTLQGQGIDGAHWRIGQHGFTSEVQSGSIERFIGR